ncbi:hypothetical protein DSL92_02110 [Billgrantia gudaonensis]|uniref:Uncharacterized protein n=1 Tax=Billgrantia gudaonensis TaxID=376427 RepID=A0A432JK51_9GAMM|nr:hypothetical protein DSL92_02110 [Halomonas gudaonensis]
MSHSIESMHRSESAHSAPWAKGTALALSPSVRRLDIWRCDIATMPPGVRGRGRSGTTYPQARGVRWREWCCWWSTRQRAGGGRAVRPNGVWRSAGRREPGHPVCHRGAFLCSGFRGAPRAWGSLMLRR